ncbi:MAG: hypothetical protein QXS23_05830 [Desulfurococcaceae archaeon]
MRTIIGPFKIENSTSRSGKHVIYSNLYIYSREKGLSTFSGFVIEESQDKPTYVKGWAKIVKIAVEPGYFVIYSRFVKNFAGRVKGYISVYNYKGELLYRGKYVDGVVRRSVGNPIYAWLIRVFVDVVKIPVTKMILGDEL